MIRFLFRLLALIALSIAVIMAISDATQSVAASELVLKPLGVRWYEISAESLNFTQALVQRYLLPEIWDPFFIWILNQPGVIVMGVLAALLYMIGYKPKRRRVGV